MNNQKYCSIRQKLFWMIAATYICVASGILYYFSTVVQPSMRQDREDLLTYQLQANANELNSLARERTNLATSLARKGEFLHAATRASKGGVASQQEKEKFIRNYLTREVESFPFIVGAGFFYEPFAFDSKQKLKGFYARWVPPLGMTRKVEFSTMRSTEKFNYLNSEWYRSLIPSGWDNSQHLYHDSTWTDPYREPVSLVPMLSVLVAMYGEDSSLIGLSSVDWNLDEVTEVIDRSRPSKNSVAALFSANSKKFAAVAGLQGLSLEPIDKARWMPQLLFNAPQDRYEMVRSEKDDGIPYRVYSRTLDNGLIYSVVVPEPEIFAGIADLAQGVYGLLALSIVLCAIFVFIVLRSWLASLNPLSRIADNYINGDFSESYRLQSKDEFHGIAEALFAYKQCLEYHNDVIIHLAKGDAGVIGGSHTTDSLDANGFQGLVFTLHAFLNEIQNIHEHIRLGLTDVQIEYAQFDGAWRSAAQQINESLHVLHTCLNETIAVCDESKNEGVMTRMSGPRSGIFEVLRTSLNGLLDENTRIIKESGIELQATRLVHEEVLAASATKETVFMNICEIVPSQVKGTLRSLMDVPDSILPKQAKNSLYAAKSSCEQMLQLFDEIFSYSQLEAGKMQLDIGEFSLYELLLNIKDTVRLHTIQRRQELSLIVEREVPEFVFGDERVLQSILLDVVNRSVLSTSYGGGISIRVRLVEQVLDTCTINFTVSDTGGNLQDDENPNKVGNDFGLASMQIDLNTQIASRLAELMGGALSFNIVPGFGSQSQLKIQFVTTSNELIDQQSKAHNIEEHSTALLAHQPNVLVVEDEIVTQRLMCQILQRLGYRTVATDNGEEALYLLDSQKFDLVLLDISLPNMDGIETTRRIREKKSDHANIPIVAVTGHPLRVEELGAAEVGFNACLPKPIETRVLQETLAHLKISYTIEREKDDDSDMHLRQL